mmetsp:Transcript_10505/g.27339  ORF Transcript_10505/g.27339 Transcript_10505/m.27339 type:complete len:223 (+) Transcript_10505:623-1291(+)
MCTTSTRTRWPCSSRTRSYIFCLKSQDSDSDQMNDNGPNASAKANYCREHDDWLEKTGHAVPFSPFFMNPLLVRAWQKFESECGPIIINAARNCGIVPFDPNAANFQEHAVSKVYDLVAADKVAASGEQPSELQRVEAAPPQVILQLKAAAEPGIQMAVIRKATADFFQTSWIEPVTELQRALKEQRDLKKQSIPLTIDRNTAPDTSVGLWIARPASSSSSS